MCAPKVCAASCMHASRPHDYVRRTMSALCHATSSHPCPTRRAGTHRSMTPTSTTHRGCRLESASQAPRQWYVCSRRLVHAAGPPLCHHRLQARHARRMGPSQSVTCPRQRQRTSSLQRHRQCTGPTSWLAPHSTAQATACTARLGQGGRAVGGQRCCTQRYMLCICYYSAPSRDEEHWIFLVSSVSPQACRAPPCRASIDGRTTPPSIAYIAYWRCGPLARPLVQPPRRSTPAACLSIHLPAEPLGTGRTLCTARPCLVGSPPPFSSSTPPRLVSLDRPG